MLTTDSIQSNKDTTGIHLESGTEYGTESLGNPKPASDRPSGVFGREGASAIAPIMNAAAPSALQRIWM